MNAFNRIIKVLKAITLCFALFFLCTRVYDYGKAKYDDYQEELKGTSSYHGTDVEVTVEKGDAARTVAEKLKDKGLIKYTSAFTKRLSESGKRLQPGTYTLNTGMNTLQMIETMSPIVEEAEPIDKLTIPEGFTIELIAARVEDQGICSASDFLNAVNSVTSERFPYLTEVPAGANVKYKLQGFLFPATYDIYEDTTAEDLVDMMLNAFEDYYSDDLRMIAESRGMSTYGVIVRASIIEREAKLDDERPIIAGVIQNRLDEGMKLEMCPTVLYALTDGKYDKPQVLYEDLEIDSPYNTYLYEGLPVGPICNPGLASIRAAVSPAEHNFLFYHVGDPETGAHIFTETYEEHIDTQIIGGPNGIPEDAEDLDGDGMLDYNPDQETDESDGSDEEYSEE